MKALKKNSKAKEVEKENSNAILTKPKRGRPPKASKALERNENE